MQVFVYGTLLAGKTNHSYLVDAVFIGPDRLLGADLYDLGSYPMIIPGQGIVCGEVYGITAHILGQLDELEDHPDLYQRKLTPLESGRMAWVYWGSLAQVAGYPQIRDTW